MAIGLGSVDFAGITSNIMYWMGYIIVIGILMVGFWFATYYTSFKIKIIYWPIVGSGRGGNVSIDKPKTIRVRLNKKKTSWDVFLSKIKVKPFDPEHIYPGRNAFAFRVGDTFIPAEVQFDLPIGSVKPIPYELKNWAALELRQNELEFSQKSFWDENKYFFMVVITAAICLAAVGVTVYYTYQYAAGGRIDAQAISGLSRAIENFQSIGAPG